MRTFCRFNRQMVVFCYVLTMFTTFLAVESAYGLRMTQMPAKMQTTVTTPRDRTISLKLPLLQPEFGWTFLSKQDFLAGKLILSITRAGETTTITIFENGKISEGWEPFPINNPKAGEIYSGFQSSKKYPTAPGDRLKIELQVKKDLNGIGPTETGVLPAGTYTSEGTYAWLLDEFTIPVTAPKNVSEEKVAALRKAIEFKAFLENWETQWPLKITSEEGWLSPEQRKQHEKLQKEIKEMENQANRPGGGKYPIGYSLSRGEDLKYISPSLRKEKDPANMFFLWKEGEDLRGVVVGDAANIGGVLSIFANIYPQEIEGDRELLNAKMSGDFIVRAGTPSEKIVGLLEGIMRKDLKLPVRLVFREVERKVILTQGTFLPKPLSEQRPNRIEIYSENVEQNPNTGVVTSGDFQLFLKRVGMYLNRRIISYVKIPNDGSLEWRYSDLIEGPRKADLVLKHITEQIGLTFKEESCVVRVLFVERRD